LGDAFEFSRLANEICLGKWDYAGFGGNHRSCVEHAEGFPRAPHEVKGFAACTYWSAPPPYREWNEICVWSNAAPFLTNWPQRAAFNSAPNRPLLSVKRC